MPSFLAPLLMKSMTFGVQPGSISNDPPSSYFVSSYLRVSRCLPRKARTPFRHSTFIPANSIHSTSHSPRKASSSFFRRSPCGSPPGAARMMPTISRLFMMRPFPHSPWASATPYPRPPGSLLALEGHLQELGPGLVVRADLADFVPPLLVEP